MRRLLFFALGLLFGAAVGGVLAMLFTPASGTDMRNQLKGRVERARREAQLAANARRRELEAQFTSMTDHKPRS